MLKKIHPKHAARVPICTGGDLEKAGDCLDIPVGAEGVIVNITLNRAVGAAFCKELLGRSE